MARGEVPIGRRVIQSKLVAKSARASPARPRRHVNIHNGAHSRRKLASPVGWPAYQLALEKMLVCSGRGSLAGQPRALSCLMSHSPALCVCPGPNAVRPIKGLKLVFAPQESCPFALARVHRVVLIARSLALSLVLQRV